jgi:D-3-phosphoglycerate dehydrogenase / 2-oxoglutarate reductase
MGLKMLVSDKLAEEGIAILKAEPGVEVDLRPGIKPEDLKAIIGQYDGICIRSETKLTADILANPGKLRAIARAGVGVDNVDLPTATRLGIVVMNAPDGNTLSTAELTMGLMMAVSRHIAHACASLKGGKWDKKSYMGNLLAGKTVGIVGLGRIGKAVAKRCLAFDMKVVGFDPFVAGVPGDMAKDITIVGSIEELVKQVNILTVHTPLTDETRSIVGAKELAMMPKGAFVINAARGGIIDEAALLEALNAGTIAGAGLDVYTKEPVEDRGLVDHPKVTCLPHLGASSHEAQRNVSIDACRNIMDYLTGRELRGAVNVPAINLAAAGALQPFAELGHRMGAILAGLMHGRLKRITVTYAGDIAREPYNRVTIGVVMGMLQRVSSTPLNEVNALLVARESGVEAAERTSPETSGYLSSLRVEVEGEQETHSIFGTVFQGRYARIMAIDDFPMELKPEGDLVITFNADQPGIIGEVGTVFGKHGINIASMTFGRKINTKEACLALTLDAAASTKVLDELRGKAFMKRVHHVSLPPLVSESA